MDTQAHAVLSFWFDPANRVHWFEQEDGFDTRLAQRFDSIWQAAVAGECAHWRAEIRGRLAEILVLDQFSRNLQRGRAQAYAQDGMALVLAQETLRLPEYQQLPPTEQKFILMPFMHSESRVIHAQAEAWFVQLGDAATLDFECRHKAIIDRFGRYPHRNKILGRQSTSEELIFLQQPDSSF